MTKQPFQIEDELEVGRNSLGYTFAVGLIDGRWVGYAKSNVGMFVFPSIGTLYQLGLVDRDESIKRVGAIAQDVAQGYGGVEEWLVPEDLRGDPEAYRCSVCGEVCCLEDHEDDYRDPEEDGT